MLRVGREQVLRFRLARQGLGKPAAAGELVTVAGRCCPQNSPPGAAGLALSARVRDLTGAAVAAELEGGTLVQAFGPRGAPHVYPARDAAVFTRGLLPEGEEELREFLRGAVPALDGLDLPARELVRLSAEAVAEALDGTELTKDDLGRAAARRITDRLPAGTRAGWRGRSPYAGGQFLGESLVRFALPVLSLRGLLRHGGTRGRSPLLRGASPAGDGEGARAELVRRYLRALGPSTPEDLAGWAGVGEAQARRMWETVRDDLAEVRAGDVPAWVLRECLPDLESPPRAPRVRMLAPHDPYLQVRDRALLVPDAGLRKRIWRASGNPGVVLVAGEVRALWRPKKTGRRLAVTVEPVEPAAPLRPADHSALEAETTRLAHHRSLALAPLTFL
ncbi:winged helix DNA-binding domain-containing protein [Bailinhaonella thermotolerans]|uniref:winged helix DNA-binding domain-containing protein n=1 Tax=Bailinhaonella thermotolerans TaxID=1070861 RepID=UPI00192A52C7|nr:winged helix DNA-binding domain-containing protein [Bailinhaonella thermotolerans]